MIAKRCPTTRRPSRPASESWRLYSQRQQMWLRSKANLDMENATREIDGEIVAVTYPAQTEPRPSRR